MKAFVMTITRISLMLVALCFVPFAVATIDVYEFRSDQDRERFHALTEELRCPKCQNQNLAGSNSGISQDLRLQVYEMVDDGHSNTEIVDFMVARYGEFVRYNPKVSAQTYVLWYGPFALLALGFLAIFFIASKKRKTIQQDGAKVPDDTDTLSLKEKQALDNLLNKKDLSE